MRSALNDSSLLQYHDTIGIANRRQTMSDYKGCSACHQLIHTILHNALGSRINRTCRLIQNQYRWVCDSKDVRLQEVVFDLDLSWHHHPQASCHTLWQPFDKSMCICQFCRNNFFICSIQFSEANVILHGSGKQMCILQYNSK